LLLPETETVRTQSALELMEMPQALLAQQRQQRRARETVALQAQRVQPLDRVAQCQVISAPWQRHRHRPSQHRQGEDLGQAVLESRADGNRRKPRTKVSESVRTMNAKQCMLTNL